MNRRISRLCPQLGLIVLLAGFGSGCQSLAPPTIFHPGTADYQQARAERFDPYPENEPGPRIMGSRPPGYERPMAEVDRARQPSPPPWYRSGWLPWNWSSTMR